MEWDLESCRNAFHQGRIQEWIEAYVQVPEWENLGLLARVRTYGRNWAEPELVSLDGLDRISGPGPSYTFPKNPERWQESIDRIVANAPKPEQLPPIIVWRELDGALNVADGNHRLDALAQMGYDQIWAVIHDGPLRNEEEIQARAARLAEQKTNSDRFIRFSEDCEGTSDLYQFLSQRVAADRDVLRVAAYSRQGQPIANMLLAAVQLLLCDQQEHPLARFYPNFTKEPEPMDEAFPFFREFVLENEAGIQKLLETKLIQTNEVRRCAMLFPAFLAAHRPFGDRRIHMIEIGTSAGFNLHWDRYSYVYGDADPLGNLDSNLVIDSVFRGDFRPDLTLSIPSVRRRVGIDLNPIDLENEEEVRWLEALIWPEHHDRRALLAQAIEVARSNPVEIVRGDATAVLPDLLAQVAQDDIAYVYHTFVANQFTQGQRDSLLAIIDEFGKKQDIVHMHCSLVPNFHMTRYVNAERFDQTLGELEGHARWIEWFA